MEPIQRSAKALATGVRTGLLDLEAFGSGTLVEGVDELAASVSSWSPWLRNKLRAAWVGPGPGRIGGGTGVEHLPRGDVDEEQHVVAAEDGGVDGEEVAGHGERAGYSSGLLSARHCGRPGRSGSSPGALKQGSQRRLGQAAGRYWLMSPAQVVVRST